MALVGYSDSEESDAEVKQPVATKRLERTDGNKIKVDLPSTKANAEAEVSAPAPKRQRTTGGFNSLLPPPKRAAVKPGVSLRTSSEAAFSRVPAPQLPDVTFTADPDTGAESSTREIVPEPKLVGKPTRFLPLSVSNAKKKKKPVAPPPVAEDSKALASSEARQAEVPAPSKVKQSLFSFGAEESTPMSATTGTYEPEFIRPVVGEDLSTPAPPDQPEPVYEDNSSALAGVANDLNLSASDRRKLFGRNGPVNDAAVANFDMNSEYITNQGLAAKGEVIHRTVKAIAPGRHSLQQLVSSAVGQREALEDHWAEGRRNRGEAGSKYGF